MKAQSQSPSDKTTTVEQIIELRREKRAHLLDSGKTPYGHRYERTHRLGAVHAEFESAIPKQDDPNQPTNLPTLHVAGRLQTRRDLGKLCFAHIHDHSGKLQLKVNRQHIGTETYKEFIHTVDIGDIIGASGTLCRTKTGELSLDLQSYEILSKNIRPWPEKYHGLTDVEARSRQRELDLALNKESRDRFVMRSQIIQSFRQTLYQKGFIEVETPLMQSVAGGAVAKPFITHHSALDLNLYLRIAPELFLKRLLVGGFEKVFEIGRAFRNEGIDTRHNPEFTICEAYQAYADVTDMMDLTETLIQNAAKTVGISESTYRDQKCPLAERFDRISMVDLFKKYLNLDMLELCKNNTWKEEAKKTGLTVSENATPGKSFDLLFDEKILKKLTRPTFVLDYPAIFSPLAKAKPGEPLLTDRFELFLAQEEVANAYTEQNDPEVQTQKFKDEQKKRSAGDAEAMVQDEEFILALEHGMPPAGGLGIGIDRLTMIFSGSASIREVILFPLLKPQN